MSSQKDSSSSIRLPLVGAHVSTAGGHHMGLLEAERVGCETVQFFTKNNMQWDAPPLSAQQLDLYHKQREQSSIRSIFGHSGYLINLAGEPDSDNLKKSIDSLVLELHRCDELEFPFLVLHPGAHLGRGEEEGLQQILRSLDIVFDRFQGKAKIALETTAGQGSTLGARMEHLQYLYDHCPQRESLVFCLDTCHLFAAGYDLRTASAVDAFVQHFSSLLPWNRVVCVHCNDSVGDLGSRKDRHALLGQGKIGWECFDALLHHPAFAQIPLCLETPKGPKNKNDIETLAELKRRRG
jgi:deoxyribonuclease-4